MDDLNKKINDFKPIKIDLESSIDVSLYENLSKILLRISRSGQKTSLVVSGFKEEIDSILKEQGKMISEVLQDNLKLKKDLKEFNTSILGYIDALDSLKTLIKHINDPQMRENLSAVISNYEDTSDKLGISTINAEEGSVTDRQIHYVLEARDVDNSDMDGKIIKVIQKGYMRGPILLRKASIIVGRSVQNEQG